MNPILFSMLSGALYLSCSFTTEICPAIHKGSQITMVTNTQTRPYSKVVMYEHVIGYCDIEETKYGYDKNTNMIQEWIEANPNMSVYHTIWGTQTIGSLIGMYAVHVMIVVFVLTIWAAIQDEKKKR